MISFEDELRALTDKWREKGMSIESLCSALMDEVESLRDVDSADRDRDNRRKEL